MRRCEFIAEMPVQLNRVHLLYVYVRVAPSLPLFSPATLQNHPRPSHYTRAILDHQTRRNVHTHELLEKQLGGVR